MTDTSDVRSQIVDFLHRELIGPDPRPEHAHLNGGEEILRPQDPPRMRYGAGVLFPRSATVGLQDDIGVEELQGAESGPPDGDEPEDLTPHATEGDVDQGTEHEVSRANEYLPSAMGLTALVRLPERMKVTVRAGWYERRTEAGVGRQDKKQNWQPHHWRRAVAPPPLEIEGAFLGQARPVMKYFALDSGHPDLKLALHVFSRPYAHAENVERDRMVTFTLVNRTEMSGASPKDAECFFQCGFTVESSQESGCFLEYPEHEASADDIDEQSLRLLYRHRRTFAIGHGCAALWPESASQSVVQISTDTMPCYEIKPILPREIEGLELSMRVLSCEQGRDPVEVCKRLASEYRKWIDQEAARIDVPGLPLTLRPIAREHLAGCERCHERILDGIALLETDADTRIAFAWMNEAMLRQQLHYDLTVSEARGWVMKGAVLAPEREYKAPDMERPKPGKGRWRPFQLAFILMNLRSIAQRGSADRAVIDLIWFPTGGGKTEAYLGLTAFTIFRRRLLNVSDEGTTVLMRYTLRLLTTQQFQRAASLICACELIRRSNETRLGGTRISIGLWVGDSVTPNRNSSATAKLRLLLNTGKDNPFAVLACPWCAVQMGPVPFRNAYAAKGYRKVGSQVIFRCEDADCDFHDERGLPLLVVDEAIYEERPTLLIGTVDKFAMLPWVPEARRLFGVDRQAPVAPPDLIIQDELHLISGALGSMVGMYESTISALCTVERDGRRLPPKIVASTATICRAPQQVHSLYACGEENVFLFPPQGLRAGDSFFAKETTHGADGNALPGRLYVGVFASALSSHVTAQVRVMSALLQSVLSIPAAADEALDPYWTLMVYFNSLRELGHAATLIRADIREHLNAVWDRLNIRKPAAGSTDSDRRRFINRDMELTSRIQSTQITGILQELFNRYPGSKDQRPVDVCLATNMIQVGLDVPRLGLMAVVGQPKTTSEYIQATSRVGRDRPGLVVTVFNPGKPRDRSHFEHFRSYHQSIYRWVEPTSVTPFAVPVRERALHAQLITLARYWGSDMLRERPSPPPDPALTARIRKILLERVARVDAGESDLARQMLDELIERWRRILPPVYGGFGTPPPETPLMYPSGSEPRALWGGRAKATPTSMRNVDAGCDAAVILQFPEA